MSPIKRYKLLIAYDGTAYSGWQVQPNGNTVQHEIQNAFSRLFHRYVPVTGASRTDAGVHATGQVAHFDLSEEVDLEQLLFRLNAILPKDIRIRNINQVPLTFHSRYYAKKKTYHYHLTLNKVILPFERLYTTYVYQKVDIELMKEASKAFIGTHDFRGFAHQASKGCAKNSPIKTIYGFDWKEEGNSYCLVIQGNGFLHKMVRNMVGTLIDMGYGKLPKDTIERLLKTPDRKQAGQTAAARGLFLSEIEYEDCSSIEI